MKKWVRRYDVTSYEPDAVWGVVGIIDTELNRMARSRSRDLLAEIGRQTVDQVFIGTRTVDFVKKRGEQDLWNRLAYVAMSRARFNAVLMK